MDRLKSFGVSADAVHSKLLFAPSVNPLAHPD